ncbi:hypothetical protein BDV28DRAFT_148276 [Aspergillus coremiiformis]|uniref:Rhodopsin domain-containing protein n=1 Tax=Aspergillus coremiiformis TaxID=138285 RepID=A0A5N6Z6A4_9EURO|nr:hypothetical protein BDV28DRAFT_148276 [Aspergillus coremiiformis]
MTSASLPPDHRTTAGILALYYALTAIAVLLVLLRAWVRLHLTKNWGWDDTFIVIALAALLTGLVVIQLQANVGLGRHVIYLENPKQGFLEILKYSMIYQIVNVSCAMITKYSISLYILRIRDSRALRWALAWIMLFMTLATIGAVVIIAVSCIPLEHLWNKSIPGTCLPPSKVYSVAHVQSGFTIVVDLALTSAPVIILWNVKIERGRKTLICGLMSLGLIATISNALRNAYQDGLESPDMPYDVTNAAILSIIEVGTGIIAACIPAVLPAFRRKKEPKPITNSFHDRKMARLRRGQPEPTPAWQRSTVNSDSIAMAEAKSPPEVVTKVSAP